MRARISVSGAARRLEQRGGEQVLFGAVDVEQLDRRGVVAVAAAVEPEAGDPALGLLAPALQVGDPLAAALGPLDPGDEARHHLLQLVEDHPAVVARLRQRRGQQPQDQLLVGLAGGVDADVAEGRRRQQAAQQVERLGPDRAPPGALGLLVAAGPALRRPLLDLAERARVDREDLVHRRRELRAELVVAVEAVAAFGQRLVVGDVAGRLLQVGGEAAALQHLGEDVGDPLAGDVGAAELGDRVVAVADEDALVELRGAGALVLVEGPAAARCVGGELLQVEAAHRPGIARIAGKKRPLDGLRQVDEGEDGTVEVGEMRGEQGSLLGGEVFDRVAHRRIVVGAPAGRDRGSAASKSGAAAGRPSARPGGRRGRSPGPAAVPSVRVSARPRSRRRGGGRRWRRSRERRPRGGRGTGRSARPSGIRWICVPSRSSQVNSASVGGGSTRSNPISSKKPAATSMSAGATSIPTWWSTRRIYRDGSHT